MSIERPKPAATGGPSMFRTAVEAAAAALPDAPATTVEQVALAVLRVALPLHETQHADAWKAAHERAVHFELEAVKATERAERAEAEVQRYRGVDAAAKELLARNVELGTRADNAETKCEDLEDEVARLRERIQCDPICGTYYPASEAFSAAEARMQAAHEAGEGDDDV